ncbi:solute:Na+ symporter, SSS family [Verrucomicrobium sp. GAS474]|uniref:sodium:solute symporter family protein n=1 Tax=Verrucomicrobium sp. GAS474 TaxID=1882831 RepID=UPI00087B4A94|nr:sodium:proline symporter [Verrucomicrobium sp. GAS474]SDU11598.1 solute:Na+ symporter, SSS family [Verrucomicrobium sp. GAS474]
MTPLDWLITIAPLLLVLAVGLYSRRHVRGVADFMSGGRSADRYLLCIAGGELQAGAVVFVALFEVLSHSGFALGWWGWLAGPIGLIVSISGFVVYRYRETRAMTLAQFFELRYSKRFRLFTGFLGFFAGILNFGIIPAVGARCLAYFWGFPEHVAILGVPCPTYVLMMGLFLSISLFVALSGGLVTVMIVNCLEGIVAQLFYIVIIVALLTTFDWSQIVTVLQDRPPGHSFLNPFDSSGVKDFNVWYVLMGLVISIYGTMAWQNAAGYQGAALNPHEARMGGLLGRWREMGKSATVTLLGICAMTFLAHHDFSAQAAAVGDEVARISDPNVQNQMRMPIAVSHLLPVGVKGVLCAIFLMGVFGGDATHLHSWGSIFVQDVLVPLRKKPFGPKQHLFVLRCSIGGVALFAFLFGALYRQVDYIAMWWAVTCAIYVGGIGAVIIGGLYWKKGTTAGAWAALFAGSTLSVGGILARQLHPHFPLNGTQISFIACLTAMTLYVAVSLLTSREDFNMDRLLHRGAYARTDEVAKAAASPAPAPRGAWLGRLIGFDENFSRGDKWIAGLLFGWSSLFTLIFLVGTTWYFVSPWSAALWPSFWHVVSFVLPVFFAVVTGLWFTWGGVRGMRRFFARLRNERVNHLDDGTVKDHQNLDERERAA